MIAGGGNKLPFGNLPRLLLAWLSTEAVRTQSRELVLGRSLSDFMRTLGVYSSAGGVQTRLRNQMNRLFSRCTVSSEWTRPKRAITKPFKTFRYKQTNQVLCLNLVTNAIVTWNTVYMNAAIERLRAEGRIGRDIDLGHLSPALYGHVNPYGKYRFEIEGRAPSPRPLRSPGNDA